MSLQTRIDRLLEGHARAVVRERFPDLVGIAEQSRCSWREFLALAERTQAEVSGMTDAELLAVVGGHAG